MSKKSKSSNPALRKPLAKPFFVLLGSVGVTFAAFWLWESFPDILYSLNQYIDNGEIKTFEVNYTPEKIIELYSHDLLGEGERSFQKAELKFHPYALYNIKFSTPATKTREGVLLWGLVDGEMVIDSGQWEITHGFEDAINAKASPDDFKILNALEDANGKLTIGQLQKELGIEEDLLLLLLENAKKKHLIVQKGKEIQLHFQNPRLHVLPQTHLNQSMVTQPYNYAQKVSRRYSLHQIERIAKAAFGQDFAIRSQEIVFLPIYSLDILNSDGSTRTVNFNAVTGKRKE